MGLLVPVAPPAVADDLAKENPDAAQELAERYTPVIMVKSQEEACDTDGEPYGPTAIDIVLDNPDVLLRQVGTGNPVVMRGPGASDLFGLGEGFFVDFPGGTFEPDCIYERDFNLYSADVPPTVYAHIVQQEDYPDQLAVQYWFYWYFNDWNNKHESDWEGIQVLFDASSIEEALATEPVSVGYAQHEGGERADWDSGKLERDGTHPFVYSSAGSHASYFGSALYMGRAASEGFGCDNTDGPSDRLDPRTVVLPDSIDDPNDPLAWLAYEGRWGERQGGPFNGPTGPLAKERWLEPIDWHNELRSASVVIPAGDNSGTQVIQTFCAVVEWGAGTLITLTTSPARLALTALLGLWLARWMVRRTNWSRVSPAPIRRRRRAGQLIRASGRTYVGSPIPLMALGLVYIPTAFLVGTLAVLVAFVPILRDFLEVAGTSSGTGVLIAVLAGGVANMAAYVAVNAMVAVYLDSAETDKPLSASDAAKAVWGRRRDLASGFARSLAIVAGLLVTIVGIPWGIRQLVRYQFLPHGVMLDGHNGRDSLARSSELVNGRWWHTATMIALFNGLVGLSGMVVSLVILLTFTSIPLWLFSGIAPLIYALVVPLTSVAQTLLYGDAIAEGLDAEPAEPVLV